MTLKNRLQLLSEAEIEELYARPEFNVAERELYFTMTQQEMDALRQYLATKTPRRPPKEASSFVNSFCTGSHMLMIRKTKINKTKHNRREK